MLSGSNCYRFFLLSHKFPFFSTPRPRPLRGLLSTHGTADPNTQFAVRAAGQDCSFGKFSTKNKTSLRSVPQGGHSSLPFCHHLFATPRFCAPVCGRQAESPSMGCPAPVSSAPDCASVRSRFAKPARERCRSGPPGTAAARRCFPCPAKPEMHPSAPGASEAPSHRDSPQR